MTVPFATLGGVRRDLLRCWKSVCHCEGAPLRETRDVNFQSLIFLPPEHLAIFVGFSGLNRRRRSSLALLSIEIFVDNHHAYD